VESLAVIAAVVIVIVVVAPIVSSPDPRTCGFSIVVCGGGTPPNDAGGQKLATMLIYQ